MKRSWRAKLCAILTAAVGAVGVVAWAAEPVAPTAQPPSAIQEALPENPALDLDSCEPQPSEAEAQQPEVPALDLDLDLDLELNQSPVCSPSPQCFRDRDCWGICGKNNGTCRRVNSCYSECICNVA